MAAWNSTTSCARPGAVREFTGDPLPDEVLERILDNARFAPSGGNRQGTHVIVVRDRPDPRGARRLQRSRVQSATSPRLRNGEGPWNPVAAHAGSPPKTIAAAEVPPYLGAPCCDAEVVLVVCVDLGVVAAFDQDLDRVGLIAGRVGVPVRLEHPAGRAQRGLRRRAHHYGGRRGTTSQGTARYPRRLRDRRPAADRQAGEAGQPSSNANPSPRSPPGSASTASRSRDRAPGHVPRR